MRTETLLLIEYEETFVPDDFVEFVDPAFWSELGVTIRRLPGDRGWRVKADSLSGIARTKTRELDLTVHIRPKLPGADVIFLAEYAYGQRVVPLRRPKTDRAAIDSNYEDPVAAMLIWYVEAVADFATRWLRRSYRTRTVTLHGRVRGRFLVSKYVAQQVATARNADVPCVVTERTIDTPNNRVLKAGLRRVAKLASGLPHAAAARSVRASVNAALPRFAEVSDVVIGPAEVRATNTAGPERHYAAIIQTTNDLLEGRYLGQQVGNAAVDSFLWSMPSLFEEALRGMLDQSGQFVFESARRPTAKIFNGSGTRLKSSRINPDYVLAGREGRVLLDAKYKRALKTESSNDDAVVAGVGGPALRISRSDIYQMVAYREQPAWKGANGALVYPVVLGRNELVPEPYEVQGLGEPVKLMFLDVGPHGRKNLTVFLSRLSWFASTSSSHVDDLPNAGV